MIPKNCLSSVLDRLSTDGGYFVARLSEHWDGMHVLWMSPDGKLEQYAPPEKLKTRFHSFIGYEGAWIVGDKPKHAKPIPILSLVINSWILAIGTTAWAISTGFSSIIKKVRKH